MKKLFTNFVLLVIIGLSSAFAQNDCTNSNFLMGDFTNWIGSTIIHGTYDTIPGIVQGTPNSPPSDSGQQIIISQGAIDPNTAGVVATIPPGGWACRLGNDLCNACVNSDSIIGASLEYTIAVSSSNNLFNYGYAVVLQNPNLPLSEQPKFTMIISDSAGQQVGGACGMIEITSSTNLPYTTKCLPASTVCSPQDTVVCRDWTFNVVDLSSYIGQNITIRFTVYDSPNATDFGYAYITCSCGVIQLQQYCTDTTDIIAAPLGAVSYLWNTGDTTETITINNPVNGTVYSCLLTTIGGCQITTYDTINLSSCCSALFNLYPDTSILHHYYAINHASGIPPLTYLWNWGDGTYDNIAYPSHTYSTAGSYYICLTITDAMGCTSTYCYPYYLSKNTNSIIYVDVVPDIITGINENSFENLFFLFPNPATDNNITIELPQPSTITILNLQGQQIKTLAAAGNTTLDISTLARGMYFLQVKTEKGVAVRKFIKE